MNKGFTLIELIGTVVILAIISLIAFPSIINLLNKSNNNIDTHTKEFIKTAALDFANDNKDNLQIPSEITVIELVNRGYLQSSLICNNCQLENDIVEIDQQNNFSFTYQEIAGGDCPKECN